MPIAFCHHQPLGESVAGRVQCAFCLAWVSVKETAAPAEPFVLLPGCSCARCHEARLRQKDGLYYPNASARE